MMVAPIAAKVVDIVAFVEIEPELAYQLINAMQGCGYKVIVEASDKLTEKKKKSSIWQTETYTYTKGGMSQS